ncbi:lipid-A-disaccharide synthase [Rhodopseudomonas sp. HC1]|uniref:lipid-A-disaccharide synthase n=1 Tax=Rhodopseudomonas infernalis TaxID=2897386 RepID=UPI001EE82EE5|nr:lipid-A-disaccharide synthase [Rhodopseudomonas infernalis]MCG6206890.1 lipid-A-disaccharide synthase [Rhodopseudomonas infernalis]
MTAAARPEPVRTIYLIATEESGDRLGGALMRELRARLGDGVRIEGIGGHTMAGEGLISLFPIEELSIIGFAAVVQRLPSIVKLIRRASEAALVAKPDVLVIIDSPDFTHRVARRVRARDPSIPIVDYVSPTVWAWRPGRARAMLGYVDHVLALLPFEPAEYLRLNGPPCTYVGHPLTAQIGALRPNDDEQAQRAAEPPMLLVLPGSRRSEVRHHAAAFGATLAQLRREGVAFEPVLATTPHLEPLVRDAVAGWEVQPRIVVGEQEKRAAFRRARAALAKSGTVTLELAIAGVPMVTAYRAGSVEIWIARRVVRPGTVILANLVIGQDVVPEFIQQDCVPEKLAPALRELLADTPARQRQLDAFASIDDILSTGDQTPSARAAEIVLEVMSKRRTI